MKEAMELVRASFDLSQGERASPRDEGGPPSGAVLTARANHFQLPLPKNRSGLTDSIIVPGTQNSP